MKKLIYLLLCAQFKMIAVLLLFISSACLISCDECVLKARQFISEVNPMQGPEEIIKFKTLTVKGPMIAIGQPLPDAVIAFHDKTFTEDIKKEYQYSYDTSNFVFTIKELEHFDAALGWKAFIIKGQLELTADDVEEYDVYGLYKRDSVYRYQYLSQQVEIATNFHRFAATDSSIIIYGNSYELAGLDDGTTPPAEDEELVSYP